MSAGDFPSKIPISSSEEASRAGDAHATGSLTEASSLSSPDSSPRFPGKKVLRKAPPSTRQQLPDNEDNVSKKGPPLGGPPCIG